MKQQMIDGRLVYSKMPLWQHGSKQALQGVEILTIPPYSQSQTKYEFHLPHNEVLLFGPVSGFLVEGVFEFKDQVNPEGDAPTFKKVEKNGGSEMALQPNWFEHLIKDIQVRIGGSVINIHDVPKNVDPFLNTYLYAHMFNGIKDCLFPEPQNPGRCVGLSAQDWSMSDANSVWRKYSNEIFGKETFTFRYTPPFVFPFHQQPNFTMNGEAPSALPMGLFGGNGTIILELKDKMDGIFIKPDTNKKDYRFRIVSIQLIVEEARVNPAIEKMLTNPKENLVFEGMCRMGMYENINSGIATHRCKFSNVPMPEGIFVFALPKAAMTGEYVCTTNSNKVFAEHNLQRINVSFENRPLTMRTPKLGDFRNHIIAIKQMMDHIINPPFGVIQQPRSINFNGIKDGGDGTLYPHIYINLTPSGNETRTIPLGDDGQIFAKKGDLNLEFIFNNEGALGTVTYLIYIFYTDANILYDIRKKQFTTIYNAASGD